MSPVLSHSQTPDLWLAGATTETGLLIEGTSNPRPIIVRLDSSFGRQDHLDWGLYQRTLPRRDYDFLVAFTGGDTLGFTEQDLEVFYPPEE